MSFFNMANVSISDSLIPTISFIVGDTDLLDVSNIAVAGDVKWW